MALRKIVTEGDPVLRKRAREIERINNKERMIFDDMVETMRASNGCGLAAPQVGLLKRMIVVEVAEPESDQGFHEEGLPKDEDFVQGDLTKDEDFVQGDLTKDEDAIEEDLKEDKDSLEEDLVSEEPEVEKKLVVYQLANPEIISMSGSQVGEEGCLSVPGFIGKVERPETLHLKAFDYNGNSVEIKATGFLAVALSHEIDHLNGVLFIDKATEIEELEESQDKEE